MTTQSTTLSASEKEDGASAGPDSTITPSHEVENLSHTDTSRSSQPENLSVNDTNVPLAQTSTLQDDTTIASRSSMEKPPDLEKGLVIRQPASSRHRFLSQVNTIRWHNALNAWSKAIGYILLAIIIVALCLLPDGLFAIYAYYFTYAEIFFNSRTAIHIFRNSHTEGAFKAFFWILTCLVSIPNAFFGFGVAAIGYKIGKALKMPGCIFILWMVPWAAAFLGLKSICFWIRPTVRDAYQAHIFNQPCLATGWDLDVFLSSSSTSTLPETLPVVGNANITSITYPSINYTAQLVRHIDNHLHFDFVPNPAFPGSTQPPFTNITYDWQNRTYVAFRSDSTNVSGSYQTLPNLSFPSLNLSILDDAIPFQRPGWSSCWPAAATLVSRNSTSNHQQNVLKTLTLKPGDSTQMKACAMAGPEVAQELQISLGVIFIDHYYYSLCVTKPGVQSPVGSESDPEDDYANDNR